MASFAPSPTQIPIRPSARWAGNAEVRERVDHPAFEAMDEAADVLPAFFEVEHHIADALAGAVIGVASATAGFVDREIERIGELGGVGAGAGREQAAGARAARRIRAHVPSRMAAARCSMNASASA